MTESFKNSDPFGMNFSFINMSMNFVDLTMQGLFQLL